MPPKTDNSAPMKVELQIIQFSQQITTQLAVAIQLPKQQQISLLLCKAPSQQEKEKELIPEQPTQVNKAQQQKRKSSAPAYQQTVELERKVSQNFSVPNPDDCAGAFSSEQMKIWLEDPAAKQKTNTTVSIDVVPLLLSLPVQETVTLELNDIRIVFQIDMRCMRPKFLTAQNPTPFLFQLISYSGAPQIKDPAYRARYLRPVKVSLKLFGQTFWSDEISQKNLGSDDFSTEAPIRVSCNQIMKNEAELQTMRKKIEEEVAEISIFTRTPIGQIYDGEDAKDDKLKPKQQTEFVRSKAVCKIPLKILVHQRAFDEELRLLPDYDLVGKTTVPTTDELYKRLQNKLPKFSTQLEDAKTKVKTEFDTYQLAPEAAAIGNWANATVRVRFALPRLLGDLCKDEPEKTFERLYVYASPKQLEHARTVLAHVARCNTRFVQQMGNTQSKKQFPADIEVDDAVALLSILTIEKAVGKATEDANAVTGYRFVDKDAQLMFMEAPTSAGAFTDLLPVLGQMQLHYKTGPSVTFNSRAFPASPLSLYQFSLCKPLAQLGVVFEQTVQHLQPLLQLFQVDQNMKPHALAPPQLDLRAMREANLFLNQPMLDNLIKFYGGPVPKSSNLSALFVQTAPQHKAQGDVTVSVKEETASVRTKTLSEYKPSSFHKIELKHRDFTGKVELPDIPEEIMALTRKTPNTQERRRIAAAQQAVVQQKVVDKSGAVIKDVFAKTELKSDKIIKEAVEGKRVFQYSQQTLNQQRLHNRRFLKETKDCLKRDMLIE